MKRYKFQLTALVLFSLVILPSRYVLALNGIVSKSIDQSPQTIINISANTQKSYQVYQIHPPTPSAPDATSQDNPLVTTMLYIPVVISSKPAYYVSLSGSDSNPGTYDRPWRTIQKAADTLIAGDTVKVLPGTYNEKFTPKNSGNPEAYITFTADPGTVVLDGSGVPLSTDPKGDGLVQIQGRSYIRVQNLTIRNASVNCVNISENSAGIDSTYIEISNLNIHNCEKVGIRARHTDHLLIKDNLINHISYSSGIGVWFSNNATVDHNTITNAHYYHECQGAFDEPLTISWSNNFEVKNNTLDNTEDKPPGYCSNADKLGIAVKESSQNGLIHHNTISHMNAAGIHLDGWHAGANGTPTLNHINIYQNLVKDGGGIRVGCEQPDGIVEYINIYNNNLLNTSYTGIQIRRAYGDGLRKNINIYNNTIYGALPEGGNGGAGISITTSHLGSNNADAPVIIRNNISMFYFLSSGGGWVGQIQAGNATIASRITADHNLVFGPQKCSSEYPNCVEVGSRISANPESVFRDAAAFDLHLKSGSPAIDSGITIGIVTDDFNGVSRPQPPGQEYDIGAYEFR